MANPAGIFDRVLARVGKQVVRCIERHGEILVHARSIGRSGRIANGSIASAIPLTIALSIGRPLHCKLLRPISRRHTKCGRPEFISLGVHAKLSIRALLSGYGQRQLRFVLRDSLHSIQLSFIEARA